MVDHAHGGGRDVQVDISRSSYLAAKHGKLFRLASGVLAFEGFIPEGHLSVDALTDMFSVDDPG